MKGDRRAFEINCKFSILLLVFCILSWSSAAGKRPGRSSRKRSKAARRRRQQAPSLLDHHHRRRRRLLRRRGRRRGATGGAVHGVPAVQRAGQHAELRQVRPPHRSTACGELVRLELRCVLRREANVVRREREREVPRGRLPPQLQRARAAAAVHLLLKRASQRSRQIMRGRRWLSAAGHTKVENR